MITVYVIRFFSSRFQSEPTKASIEPPTELDDTFRDKALAATIAVSVLFSSTKQQESPNPEN